jgi:glycosyltransferase XagB
MGQRTRWMKGWMQTYAVHNRRPGDLVHDLGWRGAALFHVIVLGMLLAPLLHAAFLVVLLIMAGLGQLAWPRLELWPVACFVVLVLGQGTAIATNMVGLMRTGQSGLYWWQALLPIYWGMIGLATVMALREFALRPFHWFKTPHVASSPDSGPDDGVNNTSPAAEPTPASVGRRRRWGGSAAE